MENAKELSEREIQRKTILMQVNKINESKKIYLFSLNKIENKRYLGNTISKVLCRVYYSTYYYFNAVKKNLFLMFNASVIQRFKYTL